MSTKTLTSTIGDALVRADSRLTADRAATLARQLVQGAPSSRDGHAADDD